jgi:integrase
MTTPSRASGASRVEARTAGSFGAATSTTAASSTACSKRPPATSSARSGLCGFHAGLRLPGEALGLLWGAVDFDAEVLRPYGNWVRNGYEDTTKTGLVEPVPMTPELKQVLGSLKDREWAVADDDFVFTRDQLSALPADERALREAFRDAGKAAGLKAIPMYNSRHSFGTALAREGVDVRTIQTLMRHKRLSTTEIYMAYSPRPDLHRTLVRALSAEA